MHVKLTSSKHLFDIWQETSYRRIADEQTLLKIRLPDVNITSNRLVLSGVYEHGIIVLPCFLEYIQPEYHIFLIFLMVKPCILNMVPCKSLFLNTYWSAMA